MTLRFFALLFASLLLLPGLHAAPGGVDAEQRLRRAIDEILAAADRAPNARALATDLGPILRKYVSFPVMTRRAVGPGWRQFNAEQQKRAADLFAMLVIRNYSGKLTPGQRPAITFKPTTTPAPGRVEVPTTLVYQGSRYEVVYRMEQSEGWRVTDVVIEGVSFVANYRSQFDAQFKKGGANAVINGLAQAVDNPQ